MIHSTCSCSIYLIHVIILGIPLEKSVGAPMIVSLNTRGCVLCLTRSREAARLRSCRRPPSCTPALSARQPRTIFSKEKILQRVDQICISFVSSVGSPALSVRSRQPRPRPSAWRWRHHHAHSPPRCRHAASTTSSLSSHACHHVCHHSRMPPPRPREQERSRFHRAMRAPLKC